MPAVESQVQYFGGTGGGAHEGVGPLDVVDFYSSEDSINVYIEKGGPLGQVKKILGYLKQNASPITTNTGGSDVKVVGLFPYRSFSAGATTRHVVAIVDDGTNEYEAWVSTDSAATWTFKLELGTTAGLIPDGAQMGNSLYITNGAGAGWVYDGSTVAAVGGTQSPQPTATATGTGPLRGDYQYKLISLKAGTDRQLGSAASSSVRVENTAMGLTWTADADTDVVGYELYRTTGSGFEFYRLTYIDGRTTAAFTPDEVSDPNLLQGITLERQGDAPTSGAHFVEAHESRMWWGRFNANPRRAYYSTPGVADSVGGFDFIDFTDADSASDQLTGMVGGFYGYEIFFEEYSIWSLSGTGEIVNNIANWERSKTSAQYGCVSHRSAIRVPAGAKYPTIDGQVATTGGETLAYFTPFNTINLLAPSGGGNFADEVISHPKETFLDSVQFQYRSLVIAEHDKKRGHIRWYFPHGASQTTNNKGVQWDYRHGAWTELSTAPFASACTIEEANVSQTLLTGNAVVASNSGLVFENWLGNNYNGSGNDIQADFWTKTFFGYTKDAAPMMDSLKIWQEMEIVTGATASAQSLTWSMYQDYGNASASAFSTGTIAMAGTNVTHVQAREDLFNTTSGNQLVSHGIRMRLGDDADDAAWSVPVFSIKFAPLPKVLEERA